MNLWSNIQDWLKQPFQSGQSAWKWILFLGFVIVVIVLWQMVLIHIVREVEE